MIGRRVERISDVVQPGDYAGPIMGYSGEKPAVFFIPPNVEVDGKPFDLLHHVTSPPHEFTEFPDGSLEIRQSIKSDTWHGYLDRGHSWRTV